MAGNLTEHLGYDPPDFVGPGSIYAMTLLLPEMVYYPDGYGPNVQCHLSIDEITRVYARELQDLNFIGMLDAALYVSTFQTHGVTRIVHWHPHLTVWGVKQRDMSALCDDINERVRPFLPYTTAAYQAEIRKGTLLSWLSYASKAPRKQYQLTPHKNRESFHQFDRDISAVNALRLFNVMADATLDQLTLAGGEGREIKRAMMKDLSTWRHERGERPPEREVIDFDEWIAMGRPD